MKRFADPVERAIDVIAISPDGRLAALASKRTKDARNRGVNAMEVWDLVNEKVLTSRQSVMFRSTNNEQIDSRIVARRTIATDQRNGTFYRLIPVSIPQAQIQQQLRRHGVTP